MRIPQLEVYRQAQNLAYKYKQQIEHDVAEFEKANEDSYYKGFFKRYFYEELEKLKNM